MNILIMNSRVYLKIGSLTIMKSTQVVLDNPSIYIHNFYMKGE